MLWPIISTLLQYVVSPQSLILILGLLLSGLYWLWTSKPGAQSQTASPETFAFATPLPTPIEDFRLEKVDPQAYRPFRHGPNHITMGIRKLDWDRWIEMDSQFMRFHDMKVAELEQNLEAHVKYVDNAVTRDACFEVLEELTRFLTHRYPTIFRLESNCLQNVATGEKFTYPAGTYIFTLQLKHAIDLCGSGSTDLDVNNSADPNTALVVAAKLVQDDLLLMIENEDGQYHLDAGAACLPGFWRLKEKFRTSLDELHLDAGVPHYSAKLQKSMNRFFKTLTPDKPVTRNNYFIQLDDGLPWSTRMGMKYGDQVASWATADSNNLTIEELHFRSERQTLRRLPRSKALLFTVRTYFEPITMIAKEPHVPGRLAEAIRNWDDTTSKYKGKSHWGHLLLPYLDKEHEKQVKSGVMERDTGREFPY